MFASATSSKRSAPALVVLFHALLYGALASVLLAGCGNFDDMEGAYDEPDEFRTRANLLAEFCEVEVNGYGKLNVEDEYLAKVVTCEGEQFSLETQKVIAIAARTYAKWKYQTEGQVLEATTSDQDYRCSRPVTERARQAVRETAGMVMVQNRGGGDEVFAAFYVAGDPNPDPATCHGPDYYDGKTYTNAECNSEIRPKAQNDTQYYVTYNQGKVGSSIHRTCLGHPANPLNLGAMSQYGADCLAGQGKDVGQILRHFYSDDARIIQLDGSCVDTAGSDQSLVNRPPNPGPGGDSGADPDPAPGSSDSCGDGVDASRPTIITREQWGARAPKSYANKHTPNRLTIHHTASANNEPDPVGRMRAIQDFHMDTRDWADIAYHFLIDWEGNIYQGRHEDRQGAHAGLNSAGENENPDNLGIALMGTFTSTEPSEAQMRALTQLIAYLSDKYQITLSTEDGAGKTLWGHRDIKATECPGDKVYSKFESIIAQVNQGAGADPACEDGGDETPGESTQRAFKYVRVRAISEQPRGNNQLIEGFELDSVFGENRDTGAAHLATSATSNGPVTNPNAVLGEPDNDSCDNRESTTAGLSVGGEVIVQLSSPVRSGDQVRVVQSSYHAGMSDCAPGGSAEVAVSENGQDWTVIGREVAGNTALPVVASELTFRTPTGHSTQAPGVDMSVSASSDITSVVYLAGGQTLGSSEEGPNFSFHHDFDKGGTIDLVARGYDAQGKMVATDKISVRIQDDALLRLMSPLDGEVHGRDVTFKAQASSEIARVAYLADDWEMGASTNGPDYAFSYSFDYTGVRRIEAKGYDAQGNLIAVDRINITVQNEAPSSNNPPGGDPNNPPGNGPGTGSQQGARLRFAQPTNGSIAPQALDMKVSASDEIVEVHYLADDWPLGVSTTGPDFANHYQIAYPRQLRLDAIGYDADGNIVATDQIRVTVEGATSGGGTSGPVSGVDSSLAEQLALEAGTCSSVGNLDWQDGPWCNDGRGGRSTGACFAFVKAAMIRAGVATRADIDRLASAAGMTANAVQLNPKGFIAATQAVSAQTVKDTVGLKIINVKTTDAPRGSIIAWDAGCSGFNSTHGHIEVSQGDGYACSDFCSTIKPDDSCAVVYAPAE